MPPMTLPHQITLFSQVEVAPAAAASTWRYHDYWGSQVTVFDLERAHQQLKVTASSLVEGQTPPPPNEADWDVLRGKSTRDESAELRAQTPRTVRVAEDVARGAESA